jgi:hypothetical protein
MTVSNIKKTTGSFVIRHPDPVKRTQNVVLRHCFVESPTRGDNIYRFTVPTQNGRGVVTLPDYFAYLNEDVQVWVSGRKTFARAYAEFLERSNEVLVIAEEDAVFDILVVGTRKDEDARNHFDAQGVEYVP